MHRKDKMASNADNLTLDLILQLQLDERAALREER